MSIDESQNPLYLHAFNLLPQFGPIKLLKLCKHFHNNFQNAYFAPKSEFIKSGLESEIIEAWFSKKTAINLSAEKKFLEQNGIDLLSFTNTLYPKLLLEITKPPPLLYFRGTMKESEEICLAVVGTRKITTYGRTIVPDLVGPLATAGLTIVSGLAFGVDALTHETCLKNKGRTIAVLGGGLDEKSLYPQNHQLLAQKILESGGALLSEHPPGTPNLRHHFISRNRIISGLSVGTLVIECGLESGSLITANHALEQNRQVYAVPGPIYSPQSQGPNNLLKLGAKAVTDAQDILEDLNVKNLPQEQKVQDLFSSSPAENKILHLLTHEPQMVNEIIKLSGLTPAETFAALTFLEMKGRVKNMGGQQYILTR